MRDAGHRSLAAGKLAGCTCDEEGVFFASQDRTSSHCNLTNVMNDNGKDAIKVRIRIVGDDSAYARDEANKVLVVLVQVEMILEGHDCSSADFFSFAMPVEVEPNIVTSIRVESILVL